MGLFDSVTGVKNTLLGNVEVKEKSGIITLYGISGPDLLNAMFKVWRSSKIGQNMFTSVSKTEVSFHRFFLIDIVYTLETLLDHPKVRVNRRALFKALQELKQNTSLNFVFDETYKPKDALDYSQLSKFKLQPLPQQKEYLDRYNAIVPRYGLKGHYAALDVGLGKSMTALYLSRCVHSDTTFIIAPGNAIKSPWRDTLDTAFKTPMSHWDSHSGLPLETGKSYYVFHNDALHKAVEFVKANRGTFGKVTVVIDEGHNFNDVKSQRTELLCELVKLTNSENTLWLSGTPIKAMGKECVPFIRTIDPLFDASTEKAFLACYGVASDRALDILSNRLGIVTYIIKKESNAIGGKLHEYRVKVTLPNSKDYEMKAVRDKLFEFVKQRTEYYKKNRNLFVEQYMKGLEIFEDSKSYVTNKQQYEQYKSYINEIRRGYDARQHGEISLFCNRFEKEIIDPVLPPDVRRDFRKAKSVYKYANLVVMGEALGTVFGKIRTQCNVDIAINLHNATVSLPKIDGVSVRRDVWEPISLNEIINNSTKKVICFTSYVEVIESLKDKLFSDGYKPICVYGETNKNLPSIVKDFGEKEDINPLLATFQSLSTATPLTMANTVVMLNAPFRELYYKQALGRAYRVGQDTDVHVYNVFLDTGNEPNISTRSEDIMEQMKKQVAIMMGVSDLDLKNVSIESFQTEFGLHLGGEEISMEWDIVNNPIAKFARKVRANLHLAFTSDEETLKGGLIRYSNLKADSSIVVLKQVRDELKGKKLIDKVHADNLLLHYDGKVLKSASELENAIKKVENDLKAFGDKVKTLEKELTNVNNTEQAMKTLFDTIDNETLYMFMQQVKGEFPDEIETSKDIDKVVNSLVRSIGWYLPKINDLSNRLIKNDNKHLKEVGQSLRIVVDSYYRFLVGCSYWVMRTVDVSTESFESHTLFDVLSFEEKAKELNEEGDVTDEEDADLETEYDEENESEEDTPEEGDPETEDGESEEETQTDEEPTNEPETTDEGGETEPEERPIRVPRVRQSRLVRYDPTGMDENEEEQVRNQEDQQEETPQPEVEVVEQTSSVNEEDKVYDDVDNEEMVQEVEDEVKNVHDLAKEAMGKIAESNQQIESDMMKLETVEILARKFQQHGVAQPDIIQLGQISGRGERMFDERGIALESFTIRPSQTNFRVSFEGAKTIIFSFIGAIIYFAFKAVYYIFTIIGKVLFSIAKGIDWLIRKSSKDYNRADRLDRMINTVKSNVGTETEYKRRIKENIDISHRIEEFSEHYTELLDVTLQENSKEMKDILALFKDLPEISRNVTQLYEMISKASKDLKRHMNNGEDFKRFIEVNITNKIKTFNSDKSQQRLENIEEIVENMNVLAEKKMVLGYNEVEQLLSNYKEHQLAFDRLLSVEFPKTVLNDPKILKDIDKVKEQLDDLFDENIDGLTADEASELRSNVKTMMKVFKDNARAYLKLVSLFSLVSRQWIKFMNHRSGIMTKLFEVIRGVAERGEDNETIRVLKVMLNDMKAE